MYITMIQLNESRILYVAFDKLAHKYEKDVLFFVLMYIRSLCILTNFFNLYTYTNTLSLRPSTCTILHKLFSYAVSCNAIQIGDHLSCGVIKGFFLLNCIVCFSATD